MSSWLVPRRRVVEASPATISATGAAAGAWAGDSIDEGGPWRPASSAGRREVPFWTIEKARMYSVAAYRSNPLARTIVDTYVAFGVGDKGVSYQVRNPDVRRIVEEYINDPAVNWLGAHELGMRSQLLFGETVREVMVGTVSGVVRYAPIDPLAISEVGLRGGNPLWPSKLYFTHGTHDRELTVVQVNDHTGLREGQVHFWRPFRTLETDVRSSPFLMPVLDQIDSYDTVISNLIDRTALARHLVWDVTIDGDDDAVDAYVDRRGSTRIPKSGSMEVHNKSVDIKPVMAKTGAEEDSVAAKNIMTLVAGGAGLARTWLADPEDSNRATSLTMAEPVRRRVRGVQNLWLACAREELMFVVDRAVAARRIPATVDSTDPQTGRTVQVPASQTVIVTGPEVAAADAEITAQVMLNLATGLDKLVARGLLSPAAAQVAARKAWEDYLGIPYTAELNSSEANPDDLADVADKADKKNQLRAV